MKGRVGCSQMTPHWWRWGSYAEKPVGSVFLRQYMLRRLRVVVMPDQGSSAMAVALTDSNVGADLPTSRPAVRCPALAAWSAPLGAMVLGRRDREGGGASGASSLATDTAR